MPLFAGQRLGRYEIVASIGAGGMGDVFKARDTELGREVAIKSSAERFTDRFAGEAKVIASLNHPNICTLHDVGPDYLVMELVEGPTLAERIEEGAIPEEEALRIARQIADALDYAHEKKVVHRDLKPANIKIRPDGMVKVLDFGLAKALGDEPSSGSSSLPSSGDDTRTMGPRTQAGAILGTPSYMAPEQARGERADKRADIWALGVVLYEMQTGRRLFEADTAVQTMSAVLSQPIDWERVPPKSQRLLRKCLERDKAKRLRDIGDLGPLLEEGTAPRAKTVWPWAIAAALALTTALAFWSPWRGAPNLAPKPAVGIDLDLGASVADSIFGPEAILSPDGTRLVFVSKNADGISHLSTRRLDQPNSTELPGTEGAYGPFFSSDSQGLGFFGGGKLKRTRIDGGAPSVLCDAPAGRGATWLEDGSIVAALDARRGLSLIPAGGGQPVVFTELENGELNHRFPHALPGGKAVLFTFAKVVANYEEAGIAVVSLPERRRKTLLERAGMTPIYLASGHLAYVTRGSLFAAPFDSERLELRGAAKPVIEDVATNNSIGFARVSVSQTGAFLYRQGRDENLREVQWVTSDGVPQALWPQPATSVTPRLSPDGRRLALFAANGPNSDLWVYEIEKGAKARLTSGLAGANPVWTADGQFIIFMAPGGIFSTRADGAGQPQLLLSSKLPAIPTSLTDDGRILAYQEYVPTGGAAIKTVAVENTSGQLHAASPSVFLQITTSNSYPAFSHDGHWLAYADGESGTYEVFVRAFPDQGTKVQVSNNGGHFPMWSRDGHELFYRTADNHIMVANYGIRDGVFSANKPRLWSPRPLTGEVGMTPNFDLAPDGKRIAALMHAGAGEPRPTLSRHMTLLLNFVDQLRK